VKIINGTIGPGPDGDDAITSLTFTTSTGNTATYGDPNNGSDFSVTLANASIHGFFGRSSNYLNALGFYTHTHKTICPSCNLNTMLLLYFILYFLAQLFFGQAVVVLLDWSIYGM
jgi:hypothetical protein